MNGQGIYHQGDAFLSRVVAELLYQNQIYNSLVITKAGVDGDI